MKTLLFLFFLLAASPDSEAKQTQTEGSKSSEMTINWAQKRCGDEVNSFELSSCAKELLQKTFPDGEDELNIDDVPVPHESWNQLPDRNDDDTRARDEEP